MEENLHDGHRNRLRELAFKNNFKNMEQHQQPADGQRMGYHLINIICADNDVNIFLYNNKKDRRKEGDILHKHHFCCVIYLHLDNLVPEAHPIKFA